MSSPDRDAEFAAYFAARAAALRRLAYALCGDWHAAEDLVQVTFLGRWSTRSCPTGADPGAAVLDPLLHVFP